MTINNIHYKRILNLDLPSGQSAFLWGTRKSGKSTYLKNCFSLSAYFDLLKSDIYLRYLEEPFRFREEILALPAEQRLLPIIVDEIQKVPSLLDEVHWLIENEKLSFILCGSSARKMKENGVNLLGGRAWKYHLFPLVYPEISDFDLLRVLNHGTIPSHYQTSNLNRTLDAYHKDYLIQEIQAEGYVRNLKHFAQFFRQASFANGEILNYSNISKESGIDAKTVKEYFYLLEDTLIGSHLYPFAKTLRRDSVSQQPKFYFFDVGVVNRIRKTHIRSLAGAEAGHSLETYIFHELKSYCEYNEVDKSITYWRHGKKEVDFIVGKGECAIEVKISPRLRPGDTDGLFSYLQEVQNANAYLVCQEPAERIINNKSGHAIRVMPIKEFLIKLWEGEIIKKD